MRPRCDFWKVGEGGFPAHVIIAIFIVYGTKYNSSTGSGGAESESPPALS